MKNVKAKIASGATVIALGGLTGLALSQNGGSSSQQVADKPVVHTKVIRRTVHVTKHAKPKHPPAAAPAEPAGASSAAAAAPIVSGSSGSAEPAPVSTGSSGAEAVPVTTASSGAGGGYESEEVDDSGAGEVEHEGADD